MYNNIQVLIYQPEFQLQFSKTSSGRFYPKVIPIMVNITYMDDHGWAMVKTLYMVYAHPSHHRNPYKQVYDEKYRWTWIDDHPPIWVYHRVSDFNSWWYVPLYIYTSHHPHEYPLHFWVNQCNLTMEHPTSSNSWFYIPLNSHEDPIESPQVPPPVLNCWNKPMKTIDISPTKTIVITELCSPT